MDLKSHSLHQDNNMKFSTNVDVITQLLNYTICWKTPLTGQQIRALLNVVQNRDSTPEMVKFKMHKVKKYSVS